VDVIVKFSRTITVFSRVYSSCTYSSALFIFHTVTSVWGLMKKKLIYSIVCTLITPCWQITFVLHNTSWSRDNVIVEFSRTITVFSRVYSSCTYSTLVHCSYFIQLLRFQCVRSYEKKIDIQYSMQSDNTLLTFVLNNTSWSSDNLLSDNVTLSSKNVFLYNM
jgi:hypothetical protein